MFLLLPESVSFSTRPGERLNWQNSVIVQHHFFFQEAPEDESSPSAAEAAEDPLMEDDMMSADQEPSSSSYSVSTDAYGFPFLCFWFFIFFVLFYKFSDMQIHLILVHKNIKIRILYTVSFFRIKGSIHPC